MDHKKLFFFTVLLLWAGWASAQKTAGPYGEKFKSKIIAKGLSDPWSVVYGPDDFLWVTESKSYQVSRINPSNGEKQVLLDLNDQKNFPRFDKEKGERPWPQGGLMGLALHPQLLEGKPYVYLAYAYSYEGSDSTGNYFKTRIVSYSYDQKNNTLSRPSIICDSIPGSNDHNGGRLLVAPVDGTSYLFFSIGDMGAGQYANGGRPNHAQNPSKYEGKILRFNAEPDSDFDIFDRWIPNDNPFSGPAQNAVWSLGHRNPQGLAYASIRNNDFLYSSEHGPFSDDEVNIIEKGSNYGHPLIIGHNDGNYNGFAAAVSDKDSLPGKWNTTYPLIENEEQNAQRIGPAYRDPLKSFYPASIGLLDSIFTAITSKEEEPERKAVAPSSIAVYTSSAIPGWKNSLLIPSLKEGKLVRLKLNKQGDGIESDTINYFHSSARYRDIAISPDGKKLYLATDSSSVTSGPSEEDPEGTSLKGCIVEFTWESGGADLDELEGKATEVSSQKDAKKLLKQLVSTMRSLDGGNFRRVLLGPEMKLAFNLLIKRRLSPEDIQLTKKLTSDLVSAVKKADDKPEAK